LRARRFSGWPLALAIGLAVSGCAFRLSDLGQPTNEVTAPASARLQSGDRISVTVYGEPSLSGDYQIDPGGFVSLPEAGRVSAVGLTREELAQALVKKYRSEYRKDPKVSVSFPEVR
jgi:protein involved in polysaccharide export with SLBB domain